jgi:diacylglycerol kinase
MRSQPGTLIESFRHAFAGLAHALRTQRNARIHVLVAVAVIVLGVALGIEPIKWAMIVLTVGFVFVAELLNTVVEAVIDLVTEEYHPLAKTAKDIAAGAVLTAAVTAVIVGVLLLGPPLMARLGWSP